MFFSRLLDTLEENIPHHAAKCSEKGMWSQQRRTFSV
jgi:hypothetical protein